MPHWKAFPCLGFFLWNKVSHSRPVNLAMVQSRIPTNTIRWPNAGLMLAQRRRRWANISPALGQRVVFAGIGLRYSKIITTLGQRHFLFSAISPMITLVIYHSFLHSVSIRWVSYKYSWVDVGSVKDDEPTWWVASFRAIWAYNDIMLIDNDDK